ncbi:MAG: AraC family transcriptional regulator [Bacteroidales bacterium]|nr:AraC family transcriptional regulator [Bacteroidales bacterium]
MKNQAVMTKTSAIEITFQEGSIVNYYKALNKKFGGEYTSDSCIINSGPIQTNLFRYDLPGEIEMNVCETVSSKPLIIKRTPDNDADLIHINLILHGKYTQAYNDQLMHVEAGSTKGIFLYDGMFPINAEFQANTVIKWVGFKLKMSGLTELMEEAKPVLENLFGGKTAIAYHAILKSELETIINDIFSYKQLAFGSAPMIISKGLELFVNLINTIRLLVNDNSLSGLHPEDLKRLYALKERLTSNLEEKFTIESLAEDFGVSSSKLKRDFKQLYDTSIYHFHTLAKMDEAFRRLKTGEYSVSEVGYDMGYQNLSKFSEMFKKIKGISPKEVIKLQEVV